MTHLKRAAGLIGFVLLWELMARSGWVPAGLFPSIGAIASALGDLVRSGELLRAEWETLWRAFGALAIAVALALAAALATALSPLLRRTLEPAVDICRTLPPPALVPLAIFALGLGERMFLAVIVFAAIWPVYVNAAAALAASEPIQLHVARSVGCGRLAQVLRVRLPAALPGIFSGVRVAAGISLIASVAAEMIAGRSGIGYLLFDTAFSLRIPEMYATLMVAGLNGILLNMVVLVTRQRTVGWHLQLAAQER